METKHMLKMQICVIRLAQL